jgi:hypothetical protein
VKSIQAVFLSLVLLLSAPLPAIAGVYGELGSSVGHISSGNTYFGLSSGAESSNLGFLGSFNFFVPISPPQWIAELQFGLANRLTLVSITNPEKNLSMFTSNIAFRLEFFKRIYVGAGYAPLNLRSTNGPLKLMNNSNSTSYYLESGLIWRVIPELQIAATYSLEFGITGSGGPHSPSPTSEYGLRFRFPLNPYESKNDASSSFDGFRYPFGFMKK